MAINTATTRTLMMIFCGVTAASINFAILNRSTQQMMNIFDYDETVLGGYWLFTTSCGNRLYLRQDGTIAKWNHENSEIDDAFDSLDAFANSFIEQYVNGQSNEESPLFY